MSNYGRNYIDQGSDSFGVPARQNIPYNDQYNDTQYSNQPQYGAANRFASGQPQTAPYRPAVQNQNFGNSYNTGNDSYEMGSFQNTQGFENDALKVAQDLAARVNQAKILMDDVTKTRKEFFTSINESNNNPEIRHNLDNAVTTMKSFNEQLSYDIRAARGKFRTDLNKSRIDREMTRFQDIITAHQMEEQKIEAAQKVFKAKALCTANGWKYEGEWKIKADELVNSGQADQVFMSAALGARRQGANTALANVRERNEELKNIADQFAELSELAAMLNQMIVEQEPVVEQIAQKAQETEQHMEEGVKELGVGIEKARSARRKKWWCLLIVVVLIIIIVIVIMVVVVKPIIENSNNKRSLEYLAHTRRSIMEDIPTRMASSSQALGVLLE